MITLLSTSDTDLLSAKVAAEADNVSFHFANPNYVSEEKLDELILKTDVFVVRLLGGKRAWERGLERILASSVPLVAVSGELAVDAELTELSTAPAGVVTTAHTYLAEGGQSNLINLHNFLSDTLLFTGLGFEEPKHMPVWGHLDRTSTAMIPPQAPRIGIIYYRAQHLAGNTAYIEALSHAIEEKGGLPVPIFAASLRQASEELLQELRACDALITTVLAAGGTKPATATAGGDDEAWDVAKLAALDIPIIQGLALTNSRSDWEDNDEGLSPLDVATQIAVPEFDGRLISVPFSFKEHDSDGLIAYVPDAERCSRLAGIAIRHAALRTIKNKDKKLVLMLSAYPTKHARIGNAVGLDTPLSTLRVLQALDKAGYNLGNTSDIPGYSEEGAHDGDALMHAIIAAGGHDPEWLTNEVIKNNPLKLSREDYLNFFASLPQGMQDEMTQHWGQAPGTHYVDQETGELYIAGLQFGNVVVMVQPPRGFGENPVGIYHDPNLPANHHYLGVYYWLREIFGADAIVHMGKHGNMEWLPGKNAGLSADCYPDQAINELPLIYPFLVNDPGEGTQAKRRAHATLIDHMIPPMARAESYGDITRLEQLLDEHANIASMDPAKLPAIRQEIWTLLQAAKMDKDLGWEERPDEDAFDDQIMEIDGWLCEIKDAAIRGGLHVLGESVTGDIRIELVLAMLRARQLWGGDKAVPGLRESLGLSEAGDETLSRVDAVEKIAHTLLTELDAAAWDSNSVEAIVNTTELPENADKEELTKLLYFTCTEIIPRLAQSEREIEQILHALDGGFIEAGPSGSPMRGLINVLPTGRNFYSVDPKALPSRLAWETGQLLADSLIQRYQSEHNGDYPTSVGLSVWGTSAMRTSGDDIAEVFALLGVRPIWDEASRRVVDLEVISLHELGRPRIDTTVRISGFFRDAFPHVLALIDDAIQLVAHLDEPLSMNYVKVHAIDDAQQDHVRRIFGSKPGTYGAGILELIESGTWRDDKDLADVYTAWGGYAYGRGISGVEAADEMRAAYRRIQVAAKNVDSKEHDIADSDDYFQFHGGMVATVRALTGKDPEAYIGDSTRQETVKTRTLHEESRRVFRARVINPRWIAAMRNHGYKGAFEMSATVDYLFGYDATTGLMDDWMYETLTDTYVKDPENKEFFKASNPWALRDISERLLEAADRGLWETPTAEALDTLRGAFLEMEGALEEGSE
ncbi:cobaltochelatase subunit CobN [Corynebacterium pseudotuberculosis]|uniref:cobaltochelatase subunit CobN n=1 Tax=Corynebacterium pseudotuberculosis TaxID=1719 RepID=UPI000719079E|nr:cobaltochelatase subunit CobN [Corynebacterium pseudotuberculosis]ALP33691.1 Cobaltochelatase [Corynebacterium pseudotuberculosis]ALR33638.1 cobaltochelatase [Corynebacterium pseudotuberculosis]APX36082.1 cobaltochelatase subunit CobN [Corynebacterium pseudotuberculosis]APX38134.1 cobaltochelatase subunit CobN [Corynebacterium pseudotuberculosis]AQL51135.1 CobN component of cobalt chelatase involved in B12 biosynthesis [Corynebacterium pseudotuberculosis]